MINPILTRDDANPVSINDFSQGFKGPFPGMNGSQRDYYQAMEGGGNAGERIADSLVGEKFTIFPKVELNWLF